MHKNITENYDICIDHCPNVIIFRNIFAYVLTPVSFKTSQNITKEVKNCVLIDDVT